METYTITSSKMTSGKISREEIRLIVCGIHIAGRGFRVNASELTQISEILC